MPFLCKDKFEKHKKKIDPENFHGDDVDYHAIATDAHAAKAAALRYVKTSHLDEKVRLLDSEKDNDRAYLMTIINQKNKQRLMGQHHASSCHTTLGRGH